MSLLRRLFGGKAKTKKKHKNKKLNRGIVVRKKRDEESVAREEREKEMIASIKIPKLTAEEREIAKRVAIGNRNASVVFDRMSYEEAQAKVYKQGELVQAREWLKAIRSEMPGKKASIKQIAKIILPAQRDAWLSGDPGDPDSDLVISNEYVDVPSVKTLATLAKTG